MLIRTVWFARARARTTIAPCLIPRTMILNSGGGTMAVRVRPAEDRDIAAMAALRAQEWETAAFWEARIGRYLRGEHSPRQALRARALFVAVGHSKDHGKHHGENAGANGKVVGFVAGHRTRRYACDGELQWINVDQEERGQGVARALLTALAAWFVQQDALRVCVNVDPHNTVAHGLYAKFGAQPLNDHWMIWEDIRLMTARRKGAR